MENVSGCLSREVLDGLFELGKEMPEIASEIILILSSAQAIGLEFL